MGLTWILALILLVAGIVVLIRGDPVLGIVLIVLAALFGPGGFLFSRL